MSVICEHCGKPIEGFHACGCTFTNKIEIDADELATLRTRLAEVEAENGRLRELARRVLRHNVESRWGLCDAVDNEGQRYQSQALNDDIQRLRAALAQTKEPEHDD